jgi:lipopolysaccharide export system permease protein
VKVGRPEQMRLSELNEQIRTRTEVGLPTRQFSLGYHNRFAYPFAGLPAALLAVGLALRPNRKGNLTTAMVEGLIVAVTLWGLMVVCRTLVLAERLSPAIAAWAPFVVLAVAAALLWHRLQSGSRRSAA